MATLQSLPAELIREILSHLQPITELHKYGIPEEQRWDIRHWGRTLTAVARTCRTLRDIALPLLYSRYEAAFHNPVIPFIDRSSTESTAHKDLRHVVICEDGSNNLKYAPTQERLSQYLAWARVSELDSFGVKEPQQLTSGDAGQIELWRLISRAPHLQSISVKVHDYQEKIDREPNQPPLWLFPIVSAAQTIQKNSRYNGTFQELHSVTIDMQRQCGTWLVQLFSLPSLRSLCLRCWGRQPYDDWEISLVWPEPTATSGIRELSFAGATVPADVIVRMIEFCKSLESFSCSLGNDKSLEQNGRSWCIEILDGLQRDRQTLTSLSINSGDRYAPRHLVMDYEHVRGFRSLVALEVLDVPWHTLMGCPAGIRNEQNNRWECADNWEYPDMRDLLPTNLQRLKIYLSEHSLPGHAGLEEAMCSGLPKDSLEGDDGFALKNIDLVYGGAHYYRALPMNFWRVQNAYQKVGCAFTYNIKLDPFDFMWLAPAGGHEEQLNKLARTMANEGPSGVQMASRCEGSGMPRRVMNFLGLGKEWLDTEEAKEILFGEQVDYDDDGSP